MAAAIPNMEVHIEETTENNSGFHFSNFTTLQYYDWLGGGGGGGNLRETRLRSTILNLLKDRVSMISDQTTRRFYNLKKQTNVNAPWNDYDINLFLSIILGRTLLFDRNVAFPNGQDTEVRDRFKSAFLDSNDRHKLPALHLWKVFPFARNGETWRCIELSHCNKGVQWSNDQYCREAGVVGRFIKAIQQFVNEETSFQYSASTVVRFSHYCSLVVPEDDVKDVFELNSYKFRASSELFPLFQYKLHIPVSSGAGGGIIRFKTLYFERESVGQNCNAPAPAPAPALA